jgi:hypothetical protein
MSARSLLAAVQKPTKKRGIQQHLTLYAGESRMKQMSILVPAAFVGVLAAAMVLAAPQTASDTATAAKAPDRAAAYHIAIAD